MSRGQKRRQRGSIDVMPSGSRRVRVYAGMDPLSKRPNYLTEIVPVTTTEDAADAEAEKVRIRLVNQVNEARHPRTRATVDQLLERYIKLIDVDAGTLEDYEGKVRNHISSILGKVQVAKLDQGAGGVFVLESFYAELRRCRDHCDGSRRPKIQHRTNRPHRCDEHEETTCVPPQPDECKACRRMCKPHECKGLGDSTIRGIHWVLSGALDRAVRWNWISVNPARLAEKPPMPAADPRPPSSIDAARLVDRAARLEPDWGVFVWVAMTTGARRGEMCALRWIDVDLDKRVLDIRRAIGKGKGGKLVEKDTKTHQHRRVVLDPETVEVLSGQWQRLRKRTRALGVDHAGSAHIFSLAPDGSTPLKPGSVSQRFDRMAESLGIDASLKSLRQYSATELLSAGVPLRAVAGRLGHGSGGATTLRSYGAWLAEADQRAAVTLSGRMPNMPASLIPPPSVSDEGGSPASQVNERGRVSYVDSPDTERHQRYQLIARDLCAAMACGVLGAGDELPTVKELAARYSVADSTAHRAFALLAEEGLIDVRRGRRAVVRRVAPGATHVTFDVTRVERTN